MRLFFLAYVFLIHIFFVENIIGHSKSVDLSLLDEHIKSLKAVQGATFQEVEFPVLKSDDSLDKIIRRGWLFTRPDAIGTVVICHGYTQTKQESFFLKVLFPCFNVFAFDFRAHGELTENQFSTIGRDEMLDVLGAVDFLKKQPDLNEKPFIGFGFSMGAVSLLQAQSLNSSAFDILILDSPFDSSNDFVERKINQMLKINIAGKQYQLPGTKLLMNLLYKDSMRPLVKRFFKWTSGIDPFKVPTKFVPVAPIVHAEKITIPCFFISCLRDRNVTPEVIGRLYDRVNARIKWLWIAKGMKHCGSCLFQPDNYALQINQFIRQVLNNDKNMPAAFIKDERA